MDIHVLLFIDKLYITIVLFHVKGRHVTFVDWVILCQGNNMLLSIAVVIVLCKSRVIMIHRLSIPQTHATIYVGRKESQLSIFMCCCTACAMRINEFNWNILPVISINTPAEVYDTVLLVYVILHHLYIKPLMREILFILYSPHQWRNISP